MGNGVKQSKEKTPQRKNDQTLIKSPWILFPVAILLALGLLVRVELVARDTKKLALEIQRLQQSLKESVAHQDLKKEDVKAVKGRRQVFHFIILANYTYCTREGIVACRSFARNIKGDH